MQKKKENRINSYNKFDLKPMNKKKVVNFFLDGAQLLTFLAIFITGLILFPGLLFLFGIDLVSLPTYELVLIHIWIGLLMGVLAIVHVLLHWRWAFKMTKIVINRVKTQQLRRMTRNMQKYILNGGLALFSVITFITGVIKFPGFLQIFGTNPTAVPMYEITLIHDWMGLAAGMLIVIHFTLHRRWIVSTTQMILIGLRSDKTLFRTVVPLTIGLVVILGLIIAPFFQQTTQISNNIGVISPPPVDDDNFHLDNFILTYTKPTWVNNGTIIIENIGTFTFNPNEVNTTRPDIFKPGYFSIFDVLFHLDNIGVINLDYHFNASMNTHVIESINDVEYWWYYAIYSGGWRESNAFRMDHYPYKDKMRIQLFQVDYANVEVLPLRLKEMYKVFREEIRRKDQNQDKIIIPQVTIRGQSETLRFYDVEVTAHNLRGDMFQDGVITAIDVIISLSDQGEISYNLQWYDTIGTAEVRNYFVIRINNDRAHTRCGFVYEEGSKSLRLNHIHIPSDIRIINSPEYETWFWICI